VPVTEHVKRREPPGTIGWYSPDGVIDTGNSPDFA